MVCEKRTDAVEILHRRYIEGDPEQQMSLLDERAHAQVAQLIRGRRMAAGLTQKQLGKRVGMGQPDISRLEDVDYDGCTVATLARLADALGCHLVIDMEPM